MPTTTAAAVVGRRAPRKLFFLVSKATAMMHRNLPTLRPLRNGRLSLLLLPFFVASASAQAAAPIFCAQASNSGPVGFDGGPKAEVAGLSGTVSPNNGAFAMLLADGSVVAWGNAGYGGTGAPTDKGYVSISTNRYAFCALKADGTVFCWGSSYRGGTGAEPNDGQDDGGFVSIFSNNDAFAAVKADGSVFSWGSRSQGGVGRLDDIRKFGKGVSAIYGTTTAFAAVRNEPVRIPSGKFKGGLYPQINAWGLSGSGGNDDSRKRSFDRHYSPTDTVYSTQYTFAALSNDGSIASWGLGVSGRCEKFDLCKRADCCRKPPTGGGYIAVYANSPGFCALKGDGSIFCWLCWANTGQVVALSTS